MTVVSDSGPLIVLARVKLFPLTKALFERVLISAEVYDEVTCAGERLPGGAETRDADWIEVRRVVLPEDVTAAQSRFGLGVGELSTILLAKEVSADLILVDDLSARKLAVRQGFRVIGTVGLLQGCYRNGSLTDLRGAFLAMLAEGAYLDRGLLNRVLASLSLPAI